MKTIFSLLLSFLFISSTFASTIEDDSIIKQLESKNITQIWLNFELHKFKSCADMTKVMWDYIKDYWETNKSKYNRPYPILYKSLWGVNNGGIVEDSVSVNNIPEKSFIDYSKTNTQVSWVDESDIIKTDWSYIYYYNSSKKYIYIIDARDSKNLKIISKLKLPTFFSNPVLYVDNNKLVILSSGYSNRVFRWYYINRNTKTYVVVFDIKDKLKIKLDKIFISDWRLSKSRKIGNYLYIVSTNYFNIPYYTFKKADDIKITANSILPKKLDISKVSDLLKANLKIRWKKMPYRVTAWNVAKCNDIEYVLPNKDTLKKYGFNPSYNIITTIDLSDTSKEAKTTVIAWSNSNLYMSLNNMYLTENIYMSSNSRCPEWAMCIMPIYFGWTTNTLIHKFSINKDNIDYKASNIIPWRPLNQYSMDEKDDKFRIITSTNRWSSESNTSHTDLYILDKNLKLYSTLKNIWKKENFQAARFMWDKLFLVTFKQIDPLFVIDLADQKNPKIIWELKIPGYSRYLHPYDENHLIGLWYDTYQNQWWWTVNWWLKIDLYEINYDKKSWNKDYIEVKQLSSLVLWDSWSRTEAMNNPRMFMWNKNKKLLLLPATIYKNESKNSYKHKDFFQGLVAINIDKDTWIKEKYRITHIDTKWLEQQREKECNKYDNQVVEKQKCRKLLNWTEYCPPVRNVYIPEYCYADSTIWSYIASKYWTFRNEFIKRALWINNNIFAISDTKVSSHDIDSWKEEAEVKMK